MTITPTYACNDMIKPKYMYSDLILSVAVEVTYYLIRDSSNVWTSRVIPPHIAIRYYQETSPSSVPGEKAAYSDFLMRASSLCFFSRSCPF